MAFHQTETKQTMSFADRSSVVLNLNSSEGLQHQPETMDKEHANSHEISSYEQFREERIKENLERMKKLGIFDLSLNFKSLKNPIKNRPISRKAPRISSPLPPSSAPIRRSSRLLNSTPVNYSEVPSTKKEESLEVDDLLREKGSKPEFYTDEDEKLLGSTELCWTLFVDGYGKDGKRVYDPIKGKTCHQCRQKTLGHRTHCSKCSMVQGQFCGDCLYMRYGENVLEAIQNPNWICAVCRGICNCSLCRQAKGWPPTGPLYRKISSLGYKSVAHYLMQSRRSNSDSDKTAGMKVPVSAKRSLPFSEIDATPQRDDISQLDKECSGTTNPQLTFKNYLPCTASSEYHKDLSVSKPELLCSSDKQETCTNENSVTSKTSLKSSMKRAQLEPSTGSTESSKDHKNLSISKPEVLCSSNEQETCTNKSSAASKTSLKSSKKRAQVEEPSTDSTESKKDHKDVSISRPVVFCSCDEQETCKDENSVASKTSSKSSKKRAQQEPSTDSIGGRLRQRRFANLNNSQTN